jgi:UDP-arabinose 4-epimerase
VSCNALGILHFAASAYVSESLANPAKYYRNNVAGMISLLDAAVLCGVKNIVFSSSCATYGIPDTVPISENNAQRPINPYGRTKLVCEQMLIDYQVTEGIAFVALRYFNACGADPAGELFERHDPETHLIPLALLAAADPRTALQVNGNDYNTPDGTCIRDYIHVQDLARAHVLALEWLHTGGGNMSLNLGTGRGHSVIEIVEAVQRVSGKPIRTVLGPRRPGDPPTLFADPSLAREVLGFTAVRSNLETIVRDAAPGFGLALPEPRAEVSRVAG